MVKGLAELGWVDVQGLPYTPGQKESRLMWNWLAQHSGGSYIQFKNGALLSVYRADFLGVGKFGAQTMAQVFSGEKPRNLPQVFENTPSIVLNLEVAEKIEYNPPFEVLLVID